MAILCIAIYRVVFAFFPFLIASQHTQRCVSSSSKYGFVLVGSVFKYFPSQSLRLCYDACIKAPECQSLNYNLAHNICEFSSTTEKSRPENFQQKELFVYVEKNLEWGSLAMVPGQSCKDIKDSRDEDTSGTFWIRPEGSAVSFQGYCDMSAVGKWTRITKSWVDSTLKGGVTLTYGEENTGLTISGQVTANGCGQLDSGALTFIKGYWTKMKYTQEFYGVASCWSIFGDIWYGRLRVNSEPTGLYPFNATQGDSITNQHNMGGISPHVFDGKTTKCDNLATNFWRISKSVRRATVVLSRQPMAEKAGIFTGTSCGKPTYKIKEIYVYF